MPDPSTESQRDPVSSPPGGAGRLVCGLLLGLLYFVPFTAIGLIRRFLGCSPIRRRPDKQATTYWQVARPPPPPRDYFRRF